MGDQDLLATVIGGLLELTRSLGLARESELLECDGVAAAIVPQSPDRSVVNCVAYQSAAALAAALDEIDAAYAAAGVSAWTVWVPPGDAETSRLLAVRGHLLDAQPEAMGMALERPARAPDLASLTVSREPDFAELGRMNDSAYGYDGSFERAFAGFPVGGAHLYFALEDSSPLSCLMVNDHARDAEINFVATAAAARGRGLATRLLALALNDALERDMQTTTLVATKAGRPVYERLGYRPLGAIQMWEKRADN